MEITRKKLRRVKLVSWYIYWFHGMQAAEITRRSLQINLYLPQIPSKLLHAGNRASSKGSTVSAIKAARQPVLQSNCEVPKESEYLGHLHVYQSEEEARLSFPTPRATKSSPRRVLQTGGRAYFNTWFTRYRAYCPRR
jgi:hypothetical protein